jgi:hypothetical protein
LAQSVVEAAQSQLMQAYLSACLLLNSQRQLLHTWDPAQRLLRVPESSVNLDTLRLLPPRLGPLAADAMQCALREGKAHRVPPIQVDVDGQERTISVVEHPVTLETETLCVVLSLEELLDMAISAAQVPLDAVEMDRLAALERELQATRQGLQSTIEELEASNEELQATNEELMSSNEELQSTNEELQSVNEELYTVNAEYNVKLDALSALNADLEGMVQSTGIATLFVNNDLSLVHFTPEATLLFRLRPRLEGRLAAARPDRLPARACGRGEPARHHPLGESRLEFLCPPERRQPGPGLRHRCQLLGCVGTLQRPASSGDLAQSSRGHVRPPAGLHADLPVPQPRHRALVCDACAPALWDRRWRGGNPL